MHNISVSDAEIGRRLSVNRPHRPPRLSNEVPASQSGLLKAQQSNSKKISHLLSIAPQSFPLNAGIIEIILLKGLCWDCTFFCYFPAVLKVQVSKWGQLSVLGF